jgi:hypothetical protein
MRLYLSRCTQRELQHAAMAGHSHHCLVEFDQSRFSMVVDDNYALDHDYKATLLVSVMPWSSTALNLNPGACDSPRYSWDFSMTHTPLLVLLAALCCLSSSYAFCVVPMRSKCSQLHQSSYIDDLSANPPPQPEESWTQGPSDEVIAIKNQLLQLSAMTDRYAHFFCHFQAGQQVQCFPWSAIRSCCFRYDVSADDRTVLPIQGAAS